MDTSHDQQVAPRHFYKALFKEVERRVDRKKRWDDNIREWTGLQLSETFRRQKEMEEAGCQIISGAPTVSKDYGMMMMMMINLIFVNFEVFGPWIAQGKPNHLDKW